MDLGTDISEAKPVSLPQDVILGILTLLPLKSLLKFRWVSKSWLHLINDHILKKSLPRPESSFLYHPTATKYRPPSHISPPAGSSNPRFHFSCIDTRYVSDDDDDNTMYVDMSMSFLPQELKCPKPPRRLIHCCNGLVLSSWEDRDVYCVCNPAAETWDVLPSCPHRGTASYFSDYILDFNPLASPYYRVIFCYYDDQHVLFSAYSSETRAWSHIPRCSTRVCLYGSRGVIVDCALWEGALYKVTGDGQTFRYPLHDDGEEEVVYYPGGIRRNDLGEMYVGVLGEVFCLASLKKCQLRVWSVAGPRDNRWILMHESRIKDPRLCWRDSFSASEHPTIIGVHPLLNIVFLLFNGVAYAYDLDSMALEETGRLESESLSAVVRGAVAFPFSPCLFDVPEKEDVGKVL